MSYKIDKLYFDKQKFDRYIVDAAEGQLDKLTKINVFVGANNSGKSRFLRELAKISNINFRLHEHREKFQLVCREMTEQIERLVVRSGLMDIDKALSMAKGLSNFDPISEGDTFLRPLRDLISSIKAPGQTTIYHRNGTASTGPYPQIKTPLQEIADQALARLTDIIGENSETISFKRVYVPTLRSLRYLHNEDVFEKSTRSTYFKDNKDVEIFTGQNLFTELQKLLLGTLDERESVALFQEFLGETFFDGKPVALIPRHGQNNLVVKIGAERERPIYELGDGIQSIIILTFPIFQHRDSNLLYFVEEPELFLHPGMQRIFLNALLRAEFRNAQCFIATHSNHLLDLTLDIEQISVYAFQKELDDTDSREKESKTIIKNLSNEDSQSLQLLEVQNSSIFLSNCTIWVEGITDRRYLLHYLRLYYTHLHSSGRTDLREYKQDLHFSFVEYSGSNITHWSFLDDTDDPIVVERLCSRLFLITDQDMAKGAKSHRLKQLELKLQNRYYCLKCREIENLVSPTVLVDVVKSYEPANAILELPHYQDYKSRYLGEFIEDTMLLGNKQRRGSYKDESGTISNKTEFCKRVIAASQTFEQLSTEAKDLVSKLFIFIQQHNPH